VVAPRRIHHEVEALPVDHGATRVLFDPLHLLVEHQGIAQAVGKVLARPFDQQDAFAGQQQAVDPRQRDRALPGLRIVDAG
jgi:hypothetical protein